MVALLYRSQLHVLNWKTIVCELLDIDRQRVTNFSRQAPTSVIPKWTDDAVALQDGIDNITIEIC